MNVKVRFWKPDAQGFAGNDYAYFTHLDLIKGDIVVAPTKRNPMQAAIVTRINVPNEELSLAYLYNLREIEKRWEGDLPT